AQLRNSPPRVYTAPFIRIIIQLLETHSMTQKFKKVALAYSGGLDTSIIIPWLKENYGCEVVAIAGDVGQAEELHGLTDKAIKTAAIECYVEDLRHEFITEYIWPT